MVVGAVIGATIYQTATDFGFVDIKLSDPSADVTIQIDGRPALFVDGWRARLPSGEHTLEVSGKDYKTENHSIRIRRGATEVVPVDLRSTIPPDPIALRKKEMARILAKAAELARGDKPDLDEAIKWATDALRLDDMSAEALELRGHLYLDKGRLDEARRDFKKALKLDNKRPLVFLGEGMIAYKLGDLAACISNYSAAINLAPKLARVRTQRALAYFQMGETEKGIVDAGEAMSIEPDSLPLLAKRALAYAELRENERALLDLDRYLTLNPKHAIMFMARCDIHARLGNLEQAMQDRAAAIRLDRSVAARVEPVFHDTIAKRQTMVLTKNQRKAVELAAKARAAYRFQNRDEVQRVAKEALDLDPENADANALMAWVLMEGEDTRNEALRLCNEAIKHDKRCGLGYLMRSLLLKASEEADRWQVIADATVAMTLEPLESLSYARRGAAYIAMTEYAQALHDSRTALVVNPDEPLAHANIGYIEAMLGNYDKALESYNKLLKLQPKNERGYWFRAAVHRKKNDIAKAKNDELMLEKLGSDLAGSDNGFNFPEAKKPIELAKLSLDDEVKVKNLLAEAEAAHRAGKWEAGLASVGKLLKIDNHNVPGRLLRADILLLRGMNEQAAKECNEIISVQPASARAYELRAYSAKKRAIADLTIALRLEPTNAAVWQLRGHHFYRQQDYEQARADYNTALKHEPRRVESLIHRAYCNGLLANFARAMEDMEAAFELGHDEAEFHWVWAGLHLRHGNMAKAAYERARAIELDGAYAQRELPLFPNIPGEVEEIRAPRPESADGPAKKPAP